MQTDTTDSALEDVRALHSSATAPHASLSEVKDNDNDDDETTTSMSIHNN